MNIAFSALVLALLLLPGGLFRYGYLRGTFLVRRSPAANLNLTDNIGWVLVGAFIAHTLALAVLPARLGLEPDDLRLILPAITGQFGKNDQYLEALIMGLPVAGGRYAAYFALTSVGAYLLGVGLYLSVRLSGLHKRLAFLRFSDDWFYILDASGISFEGFNGLPPEARAHLVVDIYVTSVVDHKDASYLYRGVVDSYTLDSGGNLDQLRLLNAHRRKFTDDRKPGEDHNPFGDQRYYQMYGDLFVLRASEFRTLNVEYVYAAPEEEVDVTGATLNGDLEGAANQGAAPRD